MLHIAICDDDPALGEAVRAVTERFFHSQNAPCTIQTYTQSDTLDDDLREDAFFDLFLLDIEMPGASGMALAERIHTRLAAATIIFITSHLEYAITAYEYAVFRYIPKDVIAEKLPQALADFYKLYQLERDDFYTIQVKNHIEKLPHRDILYILKDGKYAVFYLRDGRTAQVRKSLASVQSALGPAFLLADRGCIINLANVDGMDGADVRVGGARLSISKASVPAFKTALLHFWEAQL